MKKLITFLSNWIWKNMNEMLIWMEEMFIREVGLENAERIAKCKKK